MVFLAEWALPFTDLEVLDEIIPSAAGMADLCRREESVHLYNGCTVLFCDIFQDIHERREAIVADFLAVTDGCLPLHIQRFQTDHRILFAKFVRQLEMIISALIVCLAVDAVAIIIASVPPLSMKMASASGTTCFAELFGSGTDEYRFSDIPREIGSYQHLAFEPEIKPDAFTCTWLDCLGIILADEIDIKISKIVPLNRYSLYLARNFAALEITVLVFANVHRMRIFIQFPSSLFECERLIPPNFLVFRRRSLLPVFKIHKEKMIGISNTIYDILECLRTYF